MPYSVEKKGGESRADSMVVCMALAVLVALSSFQVLADDMEVAGFVENATYNRESYGISKFRNTAQAEFAKDISGAFNTSSLRFNATLRVTYDGVYDLNDDQWGNKAGGSIMLENGTFGPPVPYGGGAKFAVNGVPTGFPPTLGFPPSTDFTPFFGSPQSPNAMFGLPNVDSLNNPNEGRSTRRSSG